VMRAIVRTALLASIVATAGLLQGCGTVRSSVVYACPGGIAAYSTDRQKQAADELGRLPPDSALAEMIDDYGELRKRCRAVEKKA
jgi:hypothetical protein